MINNNIKNISKNFYDLIKENTLECESVVKIARLKRGKKTKKEYDALTDMFCMHGSMYVFREPRLVTRWKSSESFYLVGFMGKDNESQESIVKLIFRPCQGMFLRYQYDKTVVDMATDLVLRGKVSYVKYFLKEVGYSLFPFHSTEVINEERISDDMVNIIQVLKSNDSVMLCHGWLDFCIIETKAVSDVVT